MRILVVEDDAVLGEVLRQSLTDFGDRVDLAINAQQARHLWSLQPFDAVLLDLNLPDGSGLDVLRWARARGNTTPVLVLTARNRTEERIAGLNAGADDYLGKPFELAEVHARLKALQRRATGGQDRISVGQLRYDRQVNRFFIQHSDDSLEPFELPAREFSVLQELMNPPGRVFSKRHLSDKLSGFDDALGDNAIEAFISRLRRKLQPCGATIRTLRGLGYVVEAQSPSD
jgi:two-component system, OmpR family, response regulator